jgi:outer membrane receptor protein involved in Fe transport
MQADAAWHLGSHTVRFGGLYQADDLTSRTSSLVLATADQGVGNPNPNNGCNTAPDPVAGPQTCQTSTLPFTVADNGGGHAWSYSLYLQDEWKLLDQLTLNYGLRYDQFKAFDAENQLSPRANLVWTPTDATTVHGGYARYFSPPPFELVASSDVALFQNTTAAPPGTTASTPRAERADYFDAGVEQKLLDHVTVGLDSFYKTSTNLIDEGQFGAPIILTPFNYAKGRQYGGELTISYDTQDFTAYINTAYERALGMDIVTSQFQFDPDDLLYIGSHYIPLDHQQLASVSAGAAYNWEGTRLSADMVYGTGLRRDGATPNGDSVPDYITVNLGASHTFDLGGFTGLTARVDVINVFDEAYEIRDGSGVGVGAPQFGARRGFFFGLSKAL